MLQVLAHQSLFQVKSVLLLENRVAGLMEIVDRLPDETPIYIVSKAVIDHVAGFPMHRGVLAIGEMPRQITETPKATENWKRIIVLAGLSNHDNVGSIFRNAAAFGADAIFIDKATCDPLYRKAIRVSVGGVFKVPYFQFETLNAIEDWLSNNNFESFALSPRGQVSLNDWKPPQKTAIVLGTEGDGLPASTLDKLQTLRVEISDNFDSLNVATTSGIVLHHLAVSQR